MTPANDELFRQRATEYAVFLAAHGDEPRSTPDDPDERRLSGWIRNCRAAAAGKATTFAWSPERRAVLDELIPGWDAPRPPRPSGPRRSMAESGRDDTRFRRNADEYARHLSRTGAPPSIQSDDRREVQLARWMIRNRQSARGAGLSPLYPDRRDLLDRMFPGWNDSDAGYRFRLRAELCAAWMRRHGTLPDLGSNHEPERELARWLDRARRSAAGMPGSPPWSAAREQLLNSLLPGWRNGDDTTRLDRFEKRAHEYAAVVTARSRHPAHSQDRVERSLYQWMIVYRRAAAGRGARGQLTAERREILDRIVRDWNRPLFVPAPKPRAHEPDRPRLGSWPLTPRSHAELAERAEHCAAFVDAQRRFPRPESSTAIERSLGAWLAKMRHDAGTLHRRDRIPLDERVPGWDCTDVRHRRRAEWCAAFLDEHGDWPATLGTRPRERELATFLHESRMSDRSASARRWSPAHAAYLDNLVPGWRNRPIGKSTEQLDEPDYRSKSFTG